MGVRGFLLLILFQCVLFTAVFADEAEESTSRSARFLTRKNKELTGYVVKQIESPSLLSCSQQCLRNGWCTSTNYKKGGKGTCELNKHNISLGNDHTSLREQQGTFFSMRLQGCLITGCLNGGSCLLDENSQTFTSCSCIAPWSGDRCEAKPECYNNPCLNGGTCINIINGFKCACPASLTGMLCELAAGPECSSYTIDTEADRSVLFSKASPHKCDRSTLTPGWYRFNSTAGSKMPTTCVPKYKCNTDASGWLDGAQPTLQEGVVQRNVCFNWNGNCCNWSVIIKVRNCGSFYVYQLVKTPSCHLRYCVTK